MKDDGDVSAFVSAFVLVFIIKSHAYFFFSSSFRSTIMKCIGHPSTLLILSEL